MNICHTAANRIRSPPVPPHLPKPIRTSTLVDHSSPKEFLTFSVVNRKKNSFFSVGFLSVFPTENRHLSVGFSVWKINRNRKTDSVFLGRFFSLVPYPNKAFIYISMETPL